MRLLLDTQVFVWSIASSKRLSKPARTLITDPSSEVFVSVASIWEIAIKASIGKLDLDAVTAYDAITRAGFSILPILGTHAVGVSSLPFHHRDPFDRMLVAQAVTEPLILLTADALLQQYGPSVRLV